MFHLRVTGRLGSGQFGTVNKGIQQSPPGAVHGSSCEDTAVMCGNPIRSNIKHNILYQTSLICKWPFLCSFDATIYVQPYDAWQNKKTLRSSQDLNLGLLNGCFKLELLNWVI